LRCVKSKYPASKITLHNELRAPVRSKKQYFSKRRKNNEKDKQNKLVVSLPLCGADCGYGTSHNGV
jgi:hypothetical protein